MGAFAADARAALAHFRMVVTMPHSTPAPARCPFAGGAPFEPGSVAAAADPHPWLRAARAEAPVFYDESGAGASTGGRTP